MNQKFAKRLDEFLEIECNDYDLKYSWGWNEDYQRCDVTITRHEQKIKHLRFKYDEAHNDLKIELCEDSYYTTREFDWTVKYFWMLISPSLFPDA